MKSRHIVLIGLAILGVWICLTLFVIPLISSWFRMDMPASGQVGDSFGAVNALFSGLAFGGIIITLIMQRQELELQREELKLTREELAKSAIAQEKSSEFQRGSAELAARQTLLEYYRFCFSEEGRKFFVERDQTQWDFIVKMEEEAKAISNLLSKVSEAKQKEK